MFRSIEWKEEGLRILDQTKLPGEIVYVDCKDVSAVAEAIRSLRIRGAPAIGIAAAYGVALAAHRASSEAALTQEVKVAVERLSAARPTAIALFHILHRMEKEVQTHRAQPLVLQKRALLQNAHAILNEDRDANREMGRLGEAIIECGDGILTYCNTGALATGGYGTALGIIRTAWHAKKQFSVYVSETRPVLQGARLTAWELTQEGIPFTLITDNMAGLMMRLGKITRCIVGADRIAANGDVANKIGTYTLAVLAKEHKLPFYVAATTGTIDFNVATGNEIPIEERNPAEVTQMAGRAFAPEGIRISNPAFDMTPAKYIRAIITEKGIFTPDQIKGLASS